jgi:hypothetical protein
MRIQVRLRTLANVSRLEYQAGLPEGHDKLKRYGIDAKRAFNAKPLGDEHLA